MKLSYPMLAICVLSLAACTAAGDGEPAAAPELGPHPVQRLEVLRHGRRAEPLLRLAERRRHGFCVFTSVGTRALLPFAKQSSGRVRCFDFR